MSEALISPELFRWAIKRSDLNKESLSKKLNIKQEKLNLWESGDSRPTFSQAKKIANTLRIPFGYLFISSPPVEKPVIPDLRTIKDLESLNYSSDFLDLLNDIFRKHQWYREYLQEEGFKKLAFIGSYTINSSIDQIAKDIIQTIGINNNLRNKSSSWEDFLRNIIRKVEESGIMVMRSGIVGNNTTRKLSVNEFRGFAISDDISPLIFLNATDAKAAQIFTLCHELAHLWIGESGVSNPDLAEPSLVNDKEIETFCNKVAAEILLPNNLFLTDWQISKSVDQNLEILVRKYRVSSLVVLHRAFDLGKIKIDDYHTYFQSEIKKQKNIAKGSGGDFYKTLLSRNSRQFTTAVVSSAYEGKLLFRDAARLLSVKVKTIHNIATNFDIR